MAGQKSEKKTAKEASTFEGSILELQTIVGQLEDGSLPLEESMQQFERGITLLRSCYRVLEQTEQRIEILTDLTEDGSVSTEPFDASATFDAQPTENNDSRTKNAGSKSQNCGTESSSEGKASTRKSKARRGPASDESLF